MLPRWPHFPSGELLIFLNNEKLTIGRLTSLQDATFTLRESCIFECNTLQNNLKVKRHHTLSLRVP